MSANSAAGIRWSRTASDTDLGGVSATLIDVPGATPSQLVLALGKDRNAYLLNRNNLGGITAPVTQLSVSGTTLRGMSAVTYRTNQGTYLLSTTMATQSPLTESPEQTHRAL